jgi:hypothetical protein
MSSRWRWWRGWRHLHCIMRCGSYLSWCAAFLPHCFGTRGHTSGCVGPASAWCEPPMTFNSSTSIGSWITGVWCKEKSYYSRFLSYNRVLNKMKCCKFSKPKVEAILNNKPLDDTHRALRCASFTCFFKTLAPKWLLNPPSECHATSTCHNSHSSTISPLHR